MIIMQMCPEVLEVTIEAIVHDKREESQIETSVYFSLSFFFYLIPFRGRIIFNIL